MKKNSGVTLVELSIVLVIIGLLITGVLSGQELIRQAEIRSDISQFESIRTGSETFRLKYGDLPADLKDATDYWPDCVDMGDIYGHGPLTTVKCNGNGDGKIQITEAHNYYYFLSKAQMIAGDYIQTITSNSKAYPHLKTTGQNIPIIGDFLTNNEAGEIYSNWYNFQPANVFLGIAQASAPLSLDTNQKPVDATVIAALDSKMDDGNGATGSMRVAYNASYLDPAPECTDANGVYNVTGQTPLICWFMLRY